MLVPKMSLFNTLAWSLKKQEASQKMERDFCKHNVIVSPIAAVEPDVISLLGQIYTSPGTWYTVTDFSNAFFSLPIK